MFEYYISFLAVGYHLYERDLPTSGVMLPTEPDPNSLLTNTEYLTHIGDMGVQGWELVNVSPLLRGCFHEGRGYGYTLTAGYYLFWKRARK